MKYTISPKRGEVVIKLPSPNLFKPNYKNSLTKGEDKVKNEDSFGVKYFKSGAKVGRPRLKMEIEAVDIDWGLPNWIVAEQLKTTVMTVFQLRKRLGIAPLPRGRPILD